MSESSTRPQRIPSTRRRSTLATTTVGNESISAPSTPSGAQHSIAQPQQTNIAQTAITTTSIPTEITTEAVTSFPEAIIHSQIQQQQILSGLPVARHSIAQGNIIFNFTFKTFKYSSSCPNSCYICTTTKSCSISSSHRFK